MNDSTLSFDKYYTHVYFIKLYTYVRRSHLTYSLTFYDKLISFSDIHINHIYGK